MARTKEFTEAQVKDALTKTHGTIHVAAQVLGCSHRTVQRYLARFPNLAELADDFREMRVDRAELKLEDAVERGEPWAIVLTLKTLGRSRGYTERIETADMGEVKFVIEYVNDWREPVKQS
jgi:hypothetical protein